MQEAFATNHGPFAGISVVRVDDTQGLLGRSAARNKGVAEAQKQGAEWVFFLDADDLMDSGAFGVMTSYHADHDAVWGLICELSEDEESYLVRQGQLPSIEHIEQVLVNDPTLTLQMGHFVRTSVAAATPFDITLNCGEDFDYYLRLWPRFRCRKVPIPLFINRRGFHSTGPRSASGSQWQNAVQSIIRTRCRAANLACEFKCDGESFRFRIVNPFDLIQRHFLRGEFFEFAELRFVRDNMRKGAAIVDVGANVGNHAVFLSRFLEPKRILVLEPNVELFDALNYNLRANGVTDADTSFLGLAIGAKGKNYELSIKDLNNVGAGHLIESSSGTIRSEPLDAIVRDHVDLIKIDVEGMELEVLEGATLTISRFRPYLLVETFNAHVEAMARWCQEHGYRVVRRFEYVNSVNLFLEAVQRN
ncbi:MAG: FkbM family methyltransferase [Betaproteobacteria bacterium]|nr:FkbM family methyltransferase [Betaproteobacteria bacterium]